ERAWRVCEILPEGNIPARTISLSGVVTFPCPLEQRGGDAEQVLHRAVGHVNHALADHGAAAVIEPQMRVLMSLSE
ncbi:MAG: hypothetical protein Q7T25_01575, partial [Sideroxyarcus sp.]|nr:hypothetical protein [Sideroxyarcus sp.]